MRHGSMNDERPTDERSRTDERSPTDERLMNETSTDECVHLLSMAEMRRAPSVCETASAQMAFHTPVMMAFQTPVRMAIHSPVKMAIHSPVRMAFHTPVRMP